MTTQKIKVGQKIKLGVKQILVIKKVHSQKHIEVYNTMYKEDYTLELWRNRWHIVREQVLFTKAIEKEMKERFGKKSDSYSWIPHLGYKYEELLLEGGSRPFGYSHLKLVEGVTEIRKERERIKDTFVFQQ